MSGEYEKLPEKVSKESYQPLGLGIWKTSWKGKQRKLPTIRTGEYEKLPEKVSEESYHPLCLGNMKNFLKR